MEAQTWFRILHICFIFSVDGLNAASRFIDFYRQFGYKMKPLFEYFFPCSRDAIVPKEKILDSFTGVTIDPSLDIDVSEQDQNRVREAFIIFIQQRLDEGKPVGDRFKC